MEDAGKGKVPKLATNESINEIKDLHLKFTKLDKKESLGVRVTRRRVKETLYSTMIGESTPLRPNNP